MSISYVILEQQHLNMSDLMSPRPLENYATANTSMGWTKSEVKF